MSQSTTDAKSWDFVIIGAGSSGCVLAERLSADPAVSVLLLEEGPPAEDWMIRLPKGFAKTLANPKRTSYFVTEHDRGVAGAKQDIWMRGKLLGGSSSVNGMVWMRGQPQDYDRFAELGLSGWSWSDMQPCFKAIENHELGGDELRGSDGPITITTSRPVTPLAEAVIKAGENMGLPRKTDQNRLEQEGLGYLQVNIDRRGRRVSAARGFLNRARSRGNLTIITGARVNKIIFEGKRAIGVEAAKDGKPVQYRSNGEFILCAGALESPAILLRSGVGPAKALADLGIATVQDSPGVGQNLREHWLLQMQFRLRNAADSLNWSFAGLRLFGNFIRYAVFGSGPLASGPYQVGGFIRSSPGANRPDAQIMFMPMSQGGKDRAGFENLPGMQIFAYQCRPNSTGSITLTSADPGAPMRIEPNYLSTEQDRINAVSSVRFIRKLVATPPLSDFIVEETAETAGAQTDEEILRAYAHLGQAGYHASGTCAMGVNADAVLDDHLRVRGVKGLRVMDLSILPELLSANTNAPAMAMAWRAAQIILGDFRAEKGLVTPAETVAA